MVRFQKTQFGVITQFGLITIPIFRNEGTTAVRKKRYIPVAFLIPRSETDQRPHERKSPTATIVKVISEGEPLRLSVAMVFEELREQRHLVAQAKRHHTELVDQRNQMMFELKAAGIPDRTLVRITGLSRSMVTRVTGGARRGSAGLDLETRNSPRLRPQRF